VFESLDDRLRADFFWRRRRWWTGLMALCWRCKSIYRLKKKRRGAGVWSDDGKQLLFINLKRCRPPEARSSPFAQRRHVSFPTGASIRS
jgi:hypothetical protein